MFVQRSHLFVFLVLLSCCATFVVHKITYCVRPSVLGDNLRATHPRRNNTPIAVLVEPRVHAKLIPIVDNFVTHLPLHWRLQLFLCADGIALVKSVESLSYWIESGRLLVFPAAMNASSKGAYSALLQSEQFWLSIQGDPVLIFQTDSVLCRNSSRPIADFLQYDYVGAPWPKSYFAATKFNGLCGNGGLSLRSKTMTLKAIRTFPINHFKGYHSEHEDMWFCAAFQSLGAKFAPRDIAHDFAVEAVFNARPLGVHQLPYPWDKMEGGSQQNKSLFYSNCPEALLLL